MHGTWVKTGTIYGTMHKTTVYLPEELKRGLEQEAQRRGTSEADVVRQAIAEAISSTRPNRGFLDAEPLAERVDELLEGFGSR
jgi:Arc/MetJ-type ribon-helix-helix transcriptional regulator